MCTHLSRLAGGENLKKGDPLKKIVNLGYIFRRLLRLLGSDYYRCRHCGYRWPRKEARISGWESASSPPHVHCPSCGRIIRRAL